MLAKITPLLKQRRFAIHFALACLLLYLLRGILLETQNTLPAKADLITTLSAKPRKILDFHPKSGAIYGPYSQQEILKSEPKLPLFDFTSPPHLILPLTEGYLPLTSWGGSLALPQWCLKVFLGVFSPQTALILYRYFFIYLFFFLLLFKIKEWVREDWAVTSCYLIALFPATHFLFLYNFSLSFSLIIFLMTLYISFSSSRLNQFFRGVLYGVGAGIHPVMLALGATHYLYFRKEKRSKDSLFFVLPFGIILSLITLPMLLASGGMRIDFNSLAYSFFTLFAPAQLFYPFYSDTTQAEYSWVLGHIPFFLLLFGLVYILYTLKIKREIWIRLSSLFSLGYILWNLSWFQEDLPAKLNIYLPLHFAFFFAIIYLVSLLPKHISWARFVFVLIAVLHFNDLRLLDENLGSPAYRRTYPYETMLTSFSAYNLNKVYILGDEWEGSLEFLSGEEFWPIYLSESRSRDILDLIRFIGKGHLVLETKNSYLNQFGTKTLFSPEALYRELKKLGYIIAHETSIRGKSGTVDFFGFSFHKTKN